MSERLSKQIVEFCGANSVHKVETVQELWSGYGEIARYQLEGSQHEKIIVKYVKLPEKNQHPRGWNTARSHARKIKSYQVECNWYQQYSALSDNRCRLPKCFGTVSAGDEFLIVMEDLADLGYTDVRKEASIADMKLCLSWLAHFHARFMETQPSSLWVKGTYWHLDTRPDELEALQDKVLRESAAKIDHVLVICPFQTIVHGDAKLANFCFHRDKPAVAAVDFQYVGGGCGMKDVAYFIGSCLDEADCERHAALLLDYYFESLCTALTEKQPHLDPKNVEAAWRPLFGLAWADFHRFLKGWSPEHWKIHGYSERLTREVISRLEQG